MASKIVEIHRKLSFMQDANQDPDVKDYMGLAFRAVGSYFREIGKVYETGLTREEENLIMPELLGGLSVEENKNEFRKQVQAFFKDICTKIPMEGLRLEIGLQQDKELSDSNPPIKPMDYVRYKHAIKHPQVAMTKDDADKYQHVLFYVVDKAAQVAGKSKLQEYEDKAQTEYLQINKDYAKMEMVLVLLGVHTKNLTQEDMVLELKAQATINPDESDAMNTERLQKFVNIVNDRELITKYDIMEMIRAGYLDRIKTKILLKETGEVIGDNLKEAVVWMQDKGNSKVVNTLYAELDTFAKGRRVKHVSPHLSDKAETKAAATTAD
jgi:uncharacterized lipoprotein YehR (DUF1307 family)